MNNKGFAITGIIYTLFILFLMLLLAILSLMKTYQRLMINSTSSFETSFEGKEVTDITSITESGITPYMGKYIFKVNNDLKCFSYLDKGIDIYNDDIILSPSICNTNIKNIELTGAYSFEGDS